MLRQTGEQHVLFTEASARIQRYNQLCLHYNLVADAVYRELRRSSAPFSAEFESYLIAALIGFDMGRMMGSGPESRYDAAAEGFAKRLRKKLHGIRPALDPLMQRSLVELDIADHREPIVRAYETLASRGEGRLSEEDKEFHVGATKILHFLNPELFMIVDGNTAATLRTTCGIAFKNSTQPGYSGEFYLESLCVARDLILKYGAERFRSLEWGMPLLRIFDKIAFAYSSLMGDSRGRRPNEALQATAKTGPRLSR